MKTIYAFCGGAAIVGLLAAAMFRNTTPVDQTFTYQGQLRNAGQLVNGAVDLKISMWDADTAGVQIGTSNTFNAVPMTDGRFALGLNFGASAFDGSNRWIQVEFRNPAGSGIYEELNPRDKITATPYALYALNGANGVWVYDTKQQSVSVLGKKIGIGTSNPSAALEVVSDTVGDDGVKLPESSIGARELTPGALVAIRVDRVRAKMNVPGGSPLIPFSKTITAPADGFMTLDFELTDFVLPSYSNTGAGYQSYIPWQFRVDGQVVWSNWSFSVNFKDWGDSFAVTVPVTAGPHTFELRSSALTSTLWGNWEVLYKVVTTFHPRAL